MSITRIDTTTGQTKWEVYVYTSGREGKRLRRRFEKRSDAESFLREYQFRKTEIQKQGAGVKDFEETTFEVEAKFWLNLQKQIFSPGHLKRAEGVLKEFLPRIGNLSPIKLHAGSLSLLQSEMLSQGLKPATVNRKLEIVTSVLNFSAKKKRIPNNPSLGFEKLQEVRDDIRFWERKEAEDFLRYAHEKYPPASNKRWIYVVYLLAINSGVRAGEIWGLQPHDIQMDGEILLIRRQLDRISKTFRPTKGKSNRRVPCNSDLGRELQTLISRDRIRSDQTIFRGELNRPIQHDNFKKRTFDRDVRQWGGKAIRFHDLRHTAASLMAADGLDLKTVQEICGHEDIQTTMNYAHLLAEKIRLAARTFSIGPSNDSARTQTHLRVIK